MEVVFTPNRKLAFAYAAGFLPALFRNKAVSKALLVFCLAMTGFLLLANLSNTFILHENVPISRWILCFLIGPILLLTIVFVLYLCHRFNLPLARKGDSIYKFFWGGGFLIRRPISCEVTAVEDQPRVHLLVIMHRPLLSKKPQIAYEGLTDDHQAAVQLASTLNHIFSQTRPKRSGHESWSE